VVSLAATAGDVGSGVAQVAFDMDGARLGTDTTAPYALSWTPARRVSASTPSPRSRPTWPATRPPRRRSR
jgi:hypothetical protein